MVYIGRHVTSHEADCALVSTGQMLACRFAPVTEHYWVEKIGIFGGRQGGTTPTTRAALYDGTGSLGSSSARLGYTVDLVPSAADTCGPSFGASYEGAMAVTNGPGAAAKLPSGTVPAIAVLATGATLTLSMIQAASVVGYDEKFYRRTGLSQPPPSLFGAVSPTTEGVLSVWAVAHLQVAPNKPLHADMSPSGEVQESAPTFTFLFRDTNRGDNGGVNCDDEVSTFRIQVRLKGGDGTLLWNLNTSADSGEKAADQISRVYGGSALTRGTEYEWRCQVSDDWNAASPWSDEGGSGWLAFTPAELGFITLDDDPTGKIESITPDFKGRWTHENAEDMQRVQVRVWNAAGTTILYTGADYNIADVASSAAPGTLFTIPNASSGIPSLAWGTSYQYDMRGHDGVDWSNWSAKRSFNTNAAPAIPSGLSPSSGAIRSTPPLLTCSAADADDTVATGLVVKCRIKDSAGVVIQTRSMTYNSGTGKWEYQTLEPDDLDDGYASYRWDAYSGDGTLWSGAVAWGSESSASKSSEATFEYAEGPVFTIDTPADTAVITAATMLVEWSLTGGGPQTHYRVRLLDTATQEEVYSSDWVASTDEDFTIPQGSYLNGSALDVEVGLRNNLALESFQTVSVTITYDPADPLTNVQVTAIRRGLDATDNALHVQWDQTEYGAEFEKYVVRRRAASGPDVTERIVAEITTASLHEFVDEHPASGIAYVYSVAQLIDLDNELLSSDPIEVSGSVAIEGMVLVNVESPTDRIQLSYVRSRRRVPRREEYVFVPEAEDVDPTTIKAASTYYEYEAQFEIRGDLWATYPQRVAALETIFESDATYCLRDDFGNKMVVSIAGRDLELMEFQWAAGALLARDQEYDGAV